jgi:hypothetical protein
MAVILDFGGDAVAFQEIKQVVAEKSMESPL